MKRSRTRAAATVEAMVATALLAMAAVGVSRFMNSFQQGVRDRELALHLGWEITNTRELIGSWPIEEVTEAAIEDLEMSPAIAAALPDAKWDAKVTELSEPTRMRQVDLRLVCTYRGQISQPEKLSFWILEEGGK